MNDTESEKSWDNFLDWINSNSSNSCYRGESNIEYLLMPKVGRKKYSLTDELNMFEHFKRRATLYTKGNNDFEWLALAQHHGLPTRLLDWTLNPLIACFFAVTSNTEKNGRVYRLDLTKNDPIDINKFSSPFEINQIHILHPPITTKRIELQKGLFSIHPIPNKALLIGTLALFGSEYRETLIEVENNYNYNTNPKPFFNQLNYENEIKEYLKDFYNENNPSFEIESIHKNYFEKRIRLLGIDETIFGDIDSISKNIEYLKYNNNLNTIRKPAFDNVKPFWKNQIENKIINFFESKNNIFESYTSYKCFDKKMYVYDIKLLNKNPNTNCLASIFCKLSFTVYPNFDGFDNIQFIDFNHEKYQNIFKIYRKITNKNSSTSIIMNTVDLKINLLIQDFEENYLEIHSAEVEKFESLEALNDNSFNMIEDIYKEIISKIEISDLEIIEAKKLNENEVEKLATKYEKFFLA